MQDKDILKRKFTLEELNALPIVGNGIWDIVLYKSEIVRLCLSRMKIEDGAKIDNTVTIEVFVFGKWKTVKQYKAK